jgi:hypothetical protein
MMLPLIVSLTARRWAPADVFVGRGVARRDEDNVAGDRPEGAVSQVD